MKKIFLPVLLVCLAGATVAKAENVYRPYIGADISFDKAKTSFNRPAYYGGSFNLGTTYNPYFGTEIFYHQTGARTKKLNNTAKYKTSFLAYGLDAIATYPVCSKFDVNLSLGLASYLFKERIVGGSHNSDEGIGFRFGGGAVYHLTNSLAVRLNARYIKFNKISNLDHAAEYTLGARYYFMEN